MHQNVWRVFKRWAYAHKVERRDRERPFGPLRKPPGLDGYAGLWVAVKDEEVVAVAPTSVALVHEVHKLGPGGRGAIAQFVPKRSDAVVIGVG